jgi:uncharacterized protein (TIGR02246 family)
MAGSTVVRDAIAAVNEEFMKAIGEGDAEAVAALYTRDAQLMPPNSDVVTGREAIQAAWQAGLDAGVRSVTLEIVEVESHGITAVEVSRYTLRGEEDLVLDRGKYIVIWKLRDGRWMLHRDIYNSSLPVPES